MITNIFIESFIQQLRTFIFFTNTLYRHWHVYKHIFYITVDSSEDHE